MILYTTYWRVHSIGTVRVEDVGQTQLVEFSQLISLTFGKQKLYPTREVSPELDFSW